MTRAVLSLGSNLGDRLGHLRSVVAGLGPAVVAVSPVFETAPWGVTDQPDFLNAVLVAEDPALDAWGWLRRGQALEDSSGRVREQRWGPRTLDVDVVQVVDGAVPVLSADPDLLLPHPGTPERSTVLLPWLLAEPGAVLHGHGLVRALLDRLGPDALDGVVRRDDLVLVPG
ncbi:2-amino-4-hydroxy-6-hydroxymethyldihydropteridine diphosphokinase [Pseudonocardia sp. HH130630-07]|uniref:2-amino-4-hydroxy-6- hydroxymethyldihydropteridine diphosphokinase n=1 Tax=Pseudonocardia sp. HH130630-07 TaxID=1690815 RepID=UPI000814D9E6|nr:2-amino-4-hydroxy-6-hydroxymethyldihydropteridine diphosphokinase [Pseudonocardia sp. HH130630-07]ANY07051.1 2-amino-4-hydroxy-6-hydroxymethyldihydropteridine pyrophosphokinase [Pseudonocardia sp. HH130630-07]